MEKVVYIKTVCQNDIWADLISNWKIAHNWIPSVIVGNNEKNKSFIKGEFENTDLYNHNDAMVGALPNFLSTKYVFSEKELNFISSYEAIFIDMIKRWSINSNKVDYFTLRNYFINMVGVWLGILKNKNITVVVCPTIPHRIYDYACYVATLITKTPYLMVECTSEIKPKSNSFVSCGFVIDNIDNRTLALYTKYLQNYTALNDDDLKLITYMNSSYSNSMPPAFLEKEIRSKQKTTLASSLFRILRIIKKIMIFIVVGFQKSKSIINFTQRSKVNSLPRIALRVEVFVSGLINKIRVQNAIEFYNNNLSEPNYDDTYVYIAPHFKPERTTVPDAGYFQDIEMIIDLISSNIPTHWKIYYKEHKSNRRKPISWNNSLTTGSYMRLLKKYPNLRFIDATKEPYELIDKSVFVATATGTSGWQAIARGKPAFIFGDAWYRHFPGVFYIKSNKDIVDAINKINNSFDISSNKIESYAKYLVSNSSEVFDIIRYQDVERIKNNNLEYISLVNEYCFHFVKKLEEIRASE